MVYDFLFGIFGLMHVPNLYIMLTWFWIFSEKDPANQRNGPLLADPRYTNAPIPYGQLFHSPYSRKSVNMVAWFVPKISM